MTPKLKPPGTKRLKLEFVGLLSNFGFKFKLRRHTKGTRLAPLPGAENNNKPGVKLPSLVDVSGVQKELTILEARAYTRSLFSST
jgi:hypothetical protein